jgi:hypothetical protein
MASSPFWDRGYIFSHESDNCSRSRCWSSSDNSRNWVEDACWLPPIGSERASNFYPSVSECDQNQCSAVLSIHASREDVHITKRKLKIVLAVKFWNATLQLNKIISCDQGSQPSFNVISSTKYMNKRKWYAKTRAFNIYLCNLHTALDSPSHHCFCGEVSKILNFFYFYYSFPLFSSSHLSYLNFLSSIICSFVLHILFS